jgi:hypothetical protein
MAGDGIDDQEVVRCLHIAWVKERKRAALMNGIAFFVESLLGADNPISAASWMSDPELSRTLNFVPPSAETVAAFDDTAVAEPLVLALNRIFDTVQPGLHADAEIDLQARLVYRNFSRL